MSNSFEHWWLKIDGTCITLKLTLEQAGILRLLEDEEKLAVNQISAKVFSNRNDGSGFMAIVGLLKSMMVPYPILEKQPDDHQFRESDIVQINQLYKPTSQHITLPEPDFSEMRDQSVDVSSNDPLSSYRERAVNFAIRDIMKRDIEVESIRVVEMVREQLAAWYNLSDLNLYHIVERVRMDSGEQFGSSDSPQAVSVEDRIGT